MSLRSPAPAHLQAQIFKDVLPRQILGDNSQAPPRSPEEGAMTAVSWQVPADNNPWQLDYEAVGNLSRPICTGKLAALLNSVLLTCVHLNALRQCINAKVAEKIQKGPQTKLKLLSYWNSITQILTNDMSTQSPILSPEGRQT